MSQKKQVSSYDLENIPSAEGMRFAIVVSEWNHNITNSLYEGAEKTLLAGGVLIKDIIKMYNAGTVKDEDHYHNMRIMKTMFGKDV